jgi:hypothetical protein
MVCYCNIVGLFFILLLYLCFFVLLLGVICFFFFFSCKSCFGLFCFLVWGMFGGCLW